MLDVHIVLPPRYHVIDDPDHICVMCNVLCGYHGNHTEGRKCGLSAGWPSPREVLNLVQLSPVTTG
jgi:hypothetical protein